MFRSQGLEEASEEGIRDCFAYLVDMAKAETLRAMGDHSAASMLADRHLE